MNERGGGGRAGRVAAPLTGSFRRLVIVTAACVGFAAVLTASALAPGSTALTVPGPQATASSTVVKTGYWMLRRDGVVYGFGASHAYPGRVADATSIAPKSDGSGYWVTSSRGAVRGFGAAAYLGGSPALRVGETITTMSATPSGTGYWLFSNRGRVFAYGHAGRYGDLGAIALNGPIVASVATPTGRGYFMVAGDGGIFAFGDARYRGSMGNRHLTSPIVGMAPTPTNQGYWLVGADGGVFAFGDARFRGSMGNTRLHRPIAGIVAFGDGYLMVATDGGVFNFSTKPFLGSLGAIPLPAPVTAIAALNTTVVEPTTTTTTIKPSTTTNTPTTANASTTTTVPSTGPYGPSAPPPGTQLCNNGADAATYLSSGFTTLPTLAKVQAAFPGYGLTSIQDVPSGSNTDLSIVKNRFYYFEPGTHYIPSIDFGAAGNINVVLYGGGSSSNPAILDSTAFSHTSQQYAIVSSGHANNVTVEYLTIRDYNAGSLDASVVGAGAGSNWVYKFNTIGPNSGTDAATDAVVATNIQGAGLQTGANATIAYNCFTRNASAGINGGSFICSPTIANGNGVCHNMGIVVDHNEFDRNNYATLQSGGVTGCAHCGWDMYPSPANNDSAATCGGTPCDNNGVAAGVKTWFWTNGTVSNNWTHGNHGAGFWSDTDNINVLYQGNYVDSNWEDGIMYEVSYNFEIRQNTFVDNNWVDGAASAGDPAPAIYISESGYDSRLANDGTGYSSIDHNTFIDNWDGVQLSEVASRMCTNGLPTDECTEPEPGQPGNVANITDCATLRASGPFGTGVLPTELAAGTLLGDCRWQTKNVHVTDNHFNFDPDNINPQSITPNAATGSCFSGGVPVSYCGFNSITAYFGSSTGPYPDYLIAHSIVWDQNNMFANNTYTGPWLFDSDSFQGLRPGNTYTFSVWQTAKGSRPVNATVPIYDQTPAPDHPAEDVGSTCTGCP